MSPQLNPNPLSLVHLVSFALYLEASWERLITARLPPQSYIVELNQILVVKPTHGLYVFLMTTHHYLVPATPLYQITSISRSRSWRPAVCRQSCQDMSSMKFFGNASYSPAEFQSRPQNRVMHLLISNNAAFPHRLLLETLLFPRWKETPHSFHVSLPAQ